MVSRTGNLQFTLAPEVDPLSGDLRFQAAPDTNGMAVVGVQLMDDGGTDRGGVDRTAVRLMTITVQSVNDVPSFTRGIDPAALEDAGPVTVLNWATDIRRGPATATDEVGQVLTFQSNVVSTTGNLAFATPPRVNFVNGALTFTAMPNTNGTASVVRATD